MGPHVGVEPAPAQVVVADDLHVERLRGLLAALVEGLGLLQAMQSSLSSSSLLVGGASAAGPQAAR